MLEALLPKELFAVLLVFVRIGATSSMQRRVVLRRQIDGLPFELVYFHTRIDKPSFGQVEVQTQFECRLTAFARQAYPQFEVLARGSGVPARLPLMSATPTGVARIDSMYVVRTQEPRLAQLLGQHLAAPHAAIFGALPLHLLGDGQSVSLLMHEKQPPQPWDVLGHAEAAAQLVVGIARAVGG